MNKEEITHRLKAGEDPVELSIELWEEIVKTSVDAHPGSFHCALCLTYLSKNCKGCPSYIRTGVTLCRATPYIDYIYEKDPEKKKEIAKRVLEFALSLRDVKKVVK